MNPELFESITVVMEIICSMPSQAEVMSKREKIKPVALAVIKLRLSEQSVSQSVSTKFH